MVNGGGIATEPMVYRVSPPLNFETTIATTERKNEKSRKEEKNRREREERTRRGIVEIRYKVIR